MKKIISLVAAMIILGVASPASAYVRAGGNNTGTAKKGNNWLTLRAFSVTSKTWTASGSVAPSSTVTLKYYTNSTCTSQSGGNRTSGLSQGHWTDSYNPGGNPSNLWVTVSATGQATLSCKAIF